MHTIRFYRIKEVSEITGLKPSTLYKLIRNKGFPPGIRLTSRSTGWPSNLIEEWIAKKMKG